LRAGGGGGGEVFEQGKNLQSFCIRIKCLHAERKQRNILQNSEEKFKKASSQERKFKQKKLTSPPPPLETLWSFISSQ